MYLWLFGDPDCLPVLTHLRNRRFYVRTLLGVFQTLIEHGAAVIVIEHDLDLIHDADYLIDMGPGGGEAGGRVVAEGTTEEIKKSSYVKGLTSLVGTDLFMNDADLQDLYQSIDLSGELVILEDIERLGIDIFDVLGYVYNLVEEGGVKMLLVANEDEIIQYSIEISAK